MHTNEATTYGADGRRDGDGPSAPPHGDTIDADDVTPIDDEDTPEEAGYGYGV